MIKQLRLLPVLWLLWIGCNTARPATADTTTPATPEPVLEQRQLDTLEVTPEVDVYEDTEEDPGEEEEQVTLPAYNPSHTRVNDLLHTRLDLRFNWEEEQVIGKASLRFKPYFYPTREVTLDAKGFEFSRVSLAGKNTNLKYEYDGQQITIQLDRPYNREEEYTLEIDYVATPAESGGSEAITSDKGLFFINPRGEEPGKPRQIWTQGETEHNSRWFPTIDKPNERTTQEMYLTVADTLETLSNGALVSSKKNNDGTRTDYWKMEKPHAPYLFMIAVGDYAIVEDEKWNGIPVNYYVEKEYAADAKAIFPYTREMLTFFSDLLKYPYPWEKYSQIIVRDYVSGAMENTTAVVFGEFMQQHERELIDVHINEKIVAHELFHHWFGDLVTPESWANLTLNEGFANYSEYLWMEKKHGRDAADYHLLEEWSGYIQSAQGGMHPLIWYAYPDKEDMFDAHSYNKGGSVLHMLRYLVGDEAFFTTLNRYLNEHKYTDVEVEDLRIAFEETTGQDLSWFFNQWFHQAGHPQFLINYEYDAENRQAVVTVEQVQEGEEIPAIFQLPVAVDVYTTAGAPTRHMVVVDERNERLTFPADTEPKLIIFDAERMLLAEREDNKTDEQLIFQFNNAKRMLDRFEAVQKLSENEAPEARQVLVTALNDPFYVIRMIALSSLGSDLEPAMVDNIRRLAKSDPHSDVRATAISKLAELEDEQAAAIAREALSARSFTVVAAGLEVLSQIDPASAVQAVQQLEDVENDDITTAVGSIYGASGDTTRLAFFEKRLEDVDSYNAISFYSDYQTLLAEAELNRSTAAIRRMQAIATDMGQSPWRRLAATKALSDLRAVYQDQAVGETDTGTKDRLNKKVMELNAALEVIKGAETDEQLKSIYQQF